MSQQNITINNYKLAGLLIRLWAYIIDLVLLVIVLLYIIPYFFYDGGVNHYKVFTYVKYMWIPSTIYRTMLESSSIQATIGKYVCGIRVCDENYVRLKLKTAFFRNILKVISGAFFYVGFLIALWSDKNKTLHDKVAKTIVIRKETSHS